MLADLQVWEKARDLSFLDAGIARDLLAGYFAAVDWPANFWFRSPGLLQKNLVNIIYTIQCIWFTRYNVYSNIVYSIHYTGRPPKMSDRRELAEIFPQAKIVLTVRRQRHFFYFASLCSFTI